MSSCDVVLHGRSPNGIVMGSETLSRCDVVLHGIYDRGGEVCHLCDAVASFLDSSGWARVVVRSKGEIVLTAVLVTQYFYRIC